MALENEKNEKFDPTEEKEKEKEKEKVREDDEPNEMPDYEGDIISIIRSGISPKAMKNRLEDYHENDIAEVLPVLTQEERVKLWRILDAEMIAEIFEHTEEDDASTYMNEITVKKAADIISQLETDTAANILRLMSKEKRELLVDMTAPDVQKEIRLISSFDEDEIGSRMTANYICIRENITVPQAMQELVKQAADNDNISTIFVVDENDLFYGAIDLKELIIARKDTKLDDLIVTSFPYVYGNENVQDCIERLKDYSENSIPVLDNSNRLLGVITSQNIIEAVDDEMGDDYAKLAGLTAEEDLNEPLPMSIKKRIPWLLILLGLGMLVSGVVGVYEKVIAQLTIIMAFQSLILDMAGNVGTQSLAVTIRVLMDENLTGKQKAKLVAKEMRVGFCNGLLLGSMSIVFVGLYIWLFKHQTVGFSYLVSSCIGVSMLVAMLISSAVGTLIPMFFKKINVDPAVASGPLITTINDLVAVVTYYSLSWVLLIQVFDLANK